MAPDKIYVSIGYEAQTKPFHHSIEYIRKDALLEWLQKEYETNKWFYEIYAKPNELHTGRCEAYKQVIDKIEAL